MKKILPVIIAVVVVGLLSFYGGMKLGESKNLQANLLQNGNFGQIGQMGEPSQNGTTGLATNQQKRIGQQGNMLNGEILNMDDKSITVKLSDSGSKIVFYSDSTKIVKSTDASVSELTQGTNVIINGSTNSDGSVTATNIQIRTADSANLQKPPVVDTQVNTQKTQASE
jgi:hypothetical protein